MKKIMIAAIFLIAAAMLVGCIDYEAAANMQVEQPTPTPEPSAEPTVALSAYESLEEENEELSSYVEKLLEDQADANEEKQNFLDENEIKEKALQQIELSLYRAVISEGDTEYYFGVIKKTEKKDNGEVILEVDLLELKNEKFDSSYYTRDQIEDINKSLEFEYASRMTENIRLTEETILRYNGASYPAYDDGFFEYVNGEITKAEAKKESSSSDEDDEQSFSGPIFIFMTLDGNALMVLEK